jgi:NAD-dependent dihydropyrimidine dehydrogenase PreA subunit
MAKTTIIYCRCSYYQVIPDNVKSAVLDTLKNAGLEVEIVPDLCRMCANQEPVLKSWAEAETIKIIACYPRAVKWLFHTGGAPLPREGVEFLNMRTDSIEKITSSLLDGQLHLAKSKIESRKSESPPLADWIPWFPVIDYDKCKNCKQCFNFCLFGVYELSREDKVEVKKPANCKTNCPACARMCPQSAIIFPKYTDSPINGDTVEGATPASNVLNELLGENIYDAIRRRGKTLRHGSGQAGKRFAKTTEKQPVEQDKYSILKKMQQELDIPPEVLRQLSQEKNNLPSAARGDEKEHHE